MDIIKHLEAVLHTMDSIAVTGIDNQSKMVGAANGILAVVQYLREEKAAREKAEEERANASAREEET